MGRDEQIFSEIRDAKILLEIKQTKIFPQKLKSKKKYGYIC